MLANLVKKQPKSKPEDAERKIILKQLKNTIRRYKKRKNGHLYIHFKFVLQGKYNIGGDKLLIWLNDEPMPAICLNKRWENPSPEFIDYVILGEGFTLMYSNNPCYDGVNDARTYYL